MNYIDQCGTRRASNPDSIQSKIIVSIEYCFISLLLWMASTFLSFYDSFKLLYIW